ncbi:hypothetical protein NDU88_002774 [Pleurodeles waltl]|uniref:Uncharacterized protein n=1 Tax=Pleurodeles waltl TaxID=8319 RepID=A0AAV7Q9U5_PLEWA|nr:hypothetical protein NDU88_002774 [Pleurodeles waltl]
MCEGELLSEKRKHVLEKQKQAQSKYVEKGKNKERCALDYRESLSRVVPNSLCQKKVVEVKRCVFKLEDGKWWNKERIAVQRNGVEDATQLDKEVEEVVKGKDVLYPVCAYTCVCTRSAIVRASKQKLHLKIRSMFNLRQSWA